MSISLMIKKINYNQLIAFNQVLNYSLMFDKKKLNNSQLCCFSVILALHLKLNQKTMFVPHSTKTFNLKLSHEQAYAILAYKELLSLAGARLESYASVIFMDITAQLDKQLQ